MEKYNNYLKPLNLLAGFCLLVLAITGCELHPDYSPKSEGVAVFTETKDIPDTLNVGSEFSFELQVVAKESKQPVKSDTVFVFVESSDPDSLVNAVNAKLINNATAVKVWGTPKTTGEFLITILASEKDRYGAYVEFEAEVVE